MTPYPVLTPLAAGAMLLVGACATTPGGAEATGDCQTVLELSSRTYAMVTGTQVGTVAPGRLLGSARFAPCDDGGGPEDGTREAYALPGVPADQAVALLGPRGRGTVYLSSEAPGAGWDADLVVLLEAWGVRPAGR